MEKLSVLRDSAPVPIRLPLVAWLVIVKAVVLARERFAASNAPVHQVVARREAQSRNALFGE